MRFLVPLFLTPWLLGQPVTTFLGNGRIPDGAYAAAALLGRDVSALPIDAGGLAVDQAGNLIVNPGGAATRISRNRIALGQQALVGVVGYGVASDPFGRVVVNGERCAFTSAPANAQGFSLIQGIGNCLAQPGNSGDGGPMGQARFLSITKIGIDRQGIIYLYDDEARRIRIAGPDGIVRAVNSTVRLSRSGEVMAAAGESGVVTCDIDGSPVRVQPSGVTPLSIPDFGCSGFHYDLDDNLYHFRRSDGALVRRTPAGAVTVIGLNGRFEFREGMPAADLDLRGGSPVVAADTAGNLYVTRRLDPANGGVLNDPANFRVMRIQVPGAARPDCTFAVSPVTAPAAGGRVTVNVRTNAEGCYWQVTAVDPWIRPGATVQRGTRGVEVEFAANTGTERAGTIVIAGQQIAVTQAGTGAPPPADAPIITNFAGRAGVLGNVPPSSNVSSLVLWTVRDMGFDSQNNAYIVDTGRSRVLRVNGRTGAVDVVAGSGNIAFETHGEGGPATQANLSFPVGIAIDASDQIFLTENNVVRRFVPGGAIQTVASFQSSGLLAAQATIRFDPPRRRFLIAQDGRVRSLTGNQLVSLSAAGSATSSPDGTRLAEASLSATNVISDANSVLYIAEPGRIRRVGADGRLTTIAGTGVRGYSGDGGPAVQAEINYPIGMAIDSRGNLYFAEIFGNRVRRVRPDGVIETFAGNGTATTSGDGGRASAAGVHAPRELAFDRDENLYIVQGGDYVIRKVTLPRPPPATISAGGWVNLSSGPLSPGALFSLYGQNLSPVTIAGDTVPLATSLGGVTVLVNNTPVPLTFVSPGQINGQIPYSAQPGRATLRVRFGNVLTDEAVGEIVPAAPGILVYGANRAVATSAEGTLLTGDAPAARGSAVVVYLTGIGAVDPPVLTGSAAPGDVLSRAVLPASATIGGQAAPIAFLGLSPGFVGLAQANLTVPDLPPGDHAIEITVGGARSNRPLIVVR